MKKQTDAALMGLVHEIDSFDCSISDPMVLLEEIKQALKLAVLTDEPGVFADDTEEDEAGKPFSWSKCSTDAFRCLAECLEAHVEQGTLYMKNATQYDEVEEVDRQRAANHVIEFCKFADPDTADYVLEKRAAGDPRFI